MTYGFHLAGAALGGDKPKDASTSGTDGPFLWQGRILNNMA